MSKRFPIGIFLLINDQLLYLVPYREICLLFYFFWLIISRKGNFMSTIIYSPESLGSVIRAARKSLSLTQPQLALAAGVGVRFIVELEAGKPSVRLSHVLSVIDALGGHLILEGLSSEHPS